MLYLNPCGPGLPRDTFTRSVLRLSGYFIASGGVLSDRISGTSFRAKVGIAHFFQNQLAVIYAVSLSWLFYYQKMTPVPNDHFPEILVN